MHGLFFASFFAKQVERALADRGSHALGLVDRETEESENTAKLDEMRKEIDVSGPNVFHGWMRSGGNCAERQFIVESASTYESTKRQTPFFLV